MLNYPRLAATARVQYFFWQYPQWWSQALCGVAWAFILPHGFQYAAHEFHHRIAFGEELGRFMLMVAAMMLPLLTYPVWLTATESLWRRRHRAVAGFLSGYFAAWLGIGIVAAGLRQSALTHTHWAAALFFVAAAAWQFTSIRRRGLAACHRVLPLAPTGWRADRDCLRFGWVIGGACVLSCWPLMMACTFAAHSPTAMLGGMAIGLSERRWFRGNRGGVLLGTLAMAAYYAVLAVVDRRSAFAPPGS